MKNKENTTIGSVENLLQLLDIEVLVKNVEAFDRITQRQYFLKALKEVRKSNAVGLQGQKSVKIPAKESRIHLDVKAEMP